MADTGQRVDAYITPEAQDCLRAQIADAGGNEVCFLGEVDRARRVADVRVLARGHDTAVAALTHLARPGSVIIHNHPDEARLVPSDADIDIAGQLGDAGVASFIVDNRVENIYVIVEPIPARELRPLDGDALAAFLRPDGPAAAVMPGFERRPQQTQMLHAVARAFNDNGVALVEAGTGTGKTFAYLIPALTWALENGERVVVSTNTINLQEQLLKKDLPLVQRVLGRDVKAVLVKGRGNYACKRKADLYRQQGELFVEEDERDELTTLLDWAAASEDGSRSDLNFTPRPDTWELIQSDTDTSLRTRCPFYKECFYHAARREANAADVLVVNHSLLLADLALRAQTGNYTDLGVLPRYDRIILDEAHHLEDVATNHFGAQATGAGLRRVLGRIHRINRAGRGRGAVAFLRKALAAAGAAAANTEAVHAFLDEEVLPFHAEAAEAIPHLVDATVEWLAAQGDPAGRERQWCVPREGVANADGATPLTEATERFCSRAGRLVDRLYTLVRMLEAGGAAATPALLPSRTELRAQAGRLEAHVATVRSVLSGGADGDVCWLTSRAGRRGALVAWRAAPIDVGPRLAEALFDRFPTTVLSSATLAIDDDFGFLQSRVGLHRLAAPERCTTLALPSPFAFEEQMGIGLPADLPAPGQPGYEERLAAAVQDAVALTGGGAFVLFTAFKLLDDVHDRCKSTFDAAGLTVLRQGDAPRDELLRRFRACDNGVLFAVDSFWEGVDVPGRALRNVIVCKLPFRVPTDPVLAARAATIEARGGSAFQSYHLPLAVLKLKQGVGRLIRGHADWGCVIILDSRLVRKSYGRLFRAALPSGHVVSGPWGEVRGGLSRFLQPFGPAPRVAQG